MSNYTPMGFSGDDYDEEDCTPLTAEQIAARDAAWPQFAGDQIPRADVTAVLTDLRDALAADKAYGAVGRLQSAMHQLGVQY